ncbi:hypothetical protein Emag_007739 [Eimeria magna]
MTRLSSLLPLCLLAALVSLFSSASSLDTFLPKQNKLSLGNVPGVEIKILGKGGAKKGKGMSKAEETGDESGEESGSPLTENMPSAEEASQKAKRKSKGFMNKLKSFGRKMRRALTGGKGRKRRVPKTVVDTDESSGGATEESSAGEDSEGNSGMHEAPVSPHEQGEEEEGSGGGSPSPRKRRLPRIGFGKGKSSEE